MTEQSDADRLVELYVLDHYRASHEREAECATLKVASYEAEDGSYGCETGCEYVRFTAVISCEHVPHYRYHFGTFGELSWIIERMGERP